MTKTIANFMTFNEGTENFGIKYETFDTLRDIDIPGKRY